MFNYNSKKRKSMKKITLLAFACAMLMAPAAANAQEVTYVEDPAQGYLFNRMQDNWFIEAEGGAGVMMSKFDRHAEFKDRIGLKGNLAIGKWFSPLLGLRIGGEFNQMKGATNKDAYMDGGIGYLGWEKANNGFNAQQFNNIGGFGDVMFNVTNWIMGYKPGRFYNAVVYAGMGVHWVFEKEDAMNKDSKWKYAAGKDMPSRNYSARAGLLNTFRLGKHVNLLLDLRFDEMQEHVDGHAKTWTEYPSALLGLSYKFGKTEWTAPVVPVCPEIKYTDAYVDDLRSKLEAANQNIASLKQQLDECRKAKQPVVQEATEAPLATIYYPIDRYDIVGVQKKVVNAVAEVMKNENNNYILTGWADNYTGNDKINTRLRKNRVAGVKKALVSKGIASERLDAQINDGNLTNYGAKCASLDRAVTINRAK